MQYVPRNYQQYTTDRILNDSKAGPLLGMGSGKTAATLAAISELYKRGEVKKVLVISTKKIIENIWRQEGKKWDQFNHLTFSMIHGMEAQRKAALKSPAHIWLVSRDNIVWLISQLGTAWPFDMIVLDESSSFKNVKSGRFKALRQILPKVNRAVILTGTPTPNGLLQLWPQVYILDRGQRLGESFAKYRQKYFTPSARFGEMVVKYEIKGKRGYEKGLGELLGADLAEQEIHEKISDICFSLRPEDYLDLPPFVEIPVPITLEPEVMKQYYDFERDQVLALADDVVLSAVNRAGLSNKLLQFAGGAVYEDSAKKVYREVHKAKIDALEEILEGANGQPVLVLYWFQHELDRILKYLKGYNPRLLKTQKDIEAWNRGEIELGLLHPQSGGHGLNLQDGGHIFVWFANIWDLELVLQTNARLYRPGQVHTVFCHRLITQGTLDADIPDILDAKADRQDTLLRAIQKRVEKYAHT